MIARNGAVELTTTAQVIVLDGVPSIRVKRGPYLLGYYTTPQAVASAGIDLAGVEIK